MRQPQRQQELQPQELPEQQLPVDVPPTEPDEQELHPHRRQPQLHVEQEFEELLPLQVDVQRFELFELLVPPTEPEFRQQGLQQELATKLGNTIPP